VQLQVLDREIESQPDVWRKAAAIAPRVAEALPEPGERLAIVGCGTSLFVGQAIAGLREAAGHGETAAFAASEANLDGRYDVVVAVSRSGETTDVARALETVPNGTETIAVLGDTASTVATLADRVIALDFADEESIVQTRFATAVLALFRAFLGTDVDTLADAAELSLGAPLPIDPAAFTRFVFLGRGWTVGVANEAALKLREAAGAWTESYPVMEYLHGPISASGSKTAVWALGDLDRSVLAASRDASARVVETGQDPMIDLVLVHRAAVRLANARGLDPEQPAHLSRAVVR
jgi:fructoselysine-6-P-deglycase FrlB-like protein